MRHLLQQLFVWILSRPLVVICIIAAITLFFGWRLPDLAFKTSIYDLQIEDLPETVQYDSFKKIFGSDEIIRVVIKSENAFDPVTFRKVEQLAEAAAGIEGVRRVISLPGVKKAVDVSGSRPDPSALYSTGTSVTVSTPAACAPSGSMTPSPTG